MRRLRSLALAFVTFVCLFAPTQFVVGSHAQSGAQTAQRLADRAIGQTPLLLKTTHLDEQMRAFDQWTDWETHRRGISR